MDGRIRRVTSHVRGSTEDDDMTNPLPKEGSWSRRRPGQAHERNSST